MARAVQNLVNDAARALGRQPSDAQPYAATLADNWFDTPDSLAACRPEELAALGIPLRFAQQIVSLAAGGGKAQGGGRQQQQQQGKAQGGSIGGGRQPAWEPRGDAPQRQQGKARAWEPREDNSQQQQGKGGGGGRQANADRDAGGRKGDGGGQKRLNVKHMEPEFRARGSILGTKGRNVHHIQDESGVKVDLKGDSDMNDKLEMVFSDAPTGEAMRAALQMGRDLLSAVYVQYDAWLTDGKPDTRGAHGEGRREGGPPGRRDDTKGGGKGGKAGRKDINSTSDKIAEAEFQHSIEIAECDPAFAFRGKLLGVKGRNVREIETKSGALLALKGESGEAMKLELGASSPEVLQQAQELAEDLIARVYADYDEWQAGGGAAAAAAGENQDGGDPKDGGRQRNQKRKTNQENLQKVTECPFNTTLDLQEAEPGFTIRGKVLGAGGHKLKRIEEEAGAAIQLQGRDGEPLSLLIGGQTQEILDAAVKAAEELLSEIYDEYAQWQENGGEAANGKGGKGRRQDAGGNKRKPPPAAKGGGKAAGEFKKILKLKECDPEFNLRHQLRGNKCENLHHIQDETRSRLWVQGEPGEPVRLEISANNAEDFEAAVRTSKDLIKTIFNDYNQWLKQKSGEPGGKRQRTA